MAAHKTQCMATHKTQFPTSAEDFADFTSTIKFVFKWHKIEENSGYGTFYADLDLDSRGLSMSVHKIHVYVFSIHITGKGVSLSGFLS